METIFLQKLTEQLRHTIRECGVADGDICLVLPSDKLWFVLHERPAPPIYREIIRDKKEHHFKDADGRYGLGIPIIVSQEGLGLVFCLGTKAAVNAKATRKRFKELAILTEHFLHNQRIREISEQKWGEPVIFIGFNSIILERKQELRMAAKSDKPVLITGETGVGKEGFARLCHLWSPRRDKTFYSVNCGQFQNENLMVSELFGHKKGSFTGAVEDHQGVFEMGNGGTIFLDEVGELSMDAQKMLLRVLDRQEIKPLGAKRIQKVDVRIVSATHRDLLQMAGQGRFREDLYYRLSTFGVHLPPLRERGEDRELLLDYYLGELNKQHGVAKTFSPEAMEFLKQYDFPGNIRELRNIVETAFWMSRTHVLELEEVTRKVRERRPSATDPAATEPTLRDILNVQTQYLQQLHVLVENVLKPPTHSTSSGQSAARIAPKADADVSTTAQELYRRMTEGGESFWQAVKEPFLNRDLNREQVKAVIRLGLEKHGGKYKKMLADFNLQDADYLKLIAFLNRNEIKPE